MIREGMSARWLSQSWAIPLIALVMMVPLIYPAVPPLVDAPGHIGRYAIQLADEDSPLRQWYRFDWQLIGNLGIDLLIIPLSKIFGLELSAKLIVMVIPAIMATGLLRLARDIHGRIPPTALFALPLAYGFSFQFGFINFNLGVGLALHLFVLWRQAEAHWPVAARAALFVPLACLLWLCHLYAWIMLGIFVTSQELVRSWSQEGKPLTRFVRAGVNTLPVAAPVFMMIFATSKSGSGDTFDWFNITIKIHWIGSALRERWMAYDMACVAVLLLVILRGLRSPDFARAPVLLVAAAIMLVSFILMPRVLLGSAYADMRLVPVMLMTAIIAFDFRAPNSRAAHLLGIAALAFFGLRLVTSTVNFAHFANAFEAQAAAINKLPIGARVVSLVAKPCGEPWSLSRMDHLPAMATIRKSAYSNDQWDVAGAQLVRISYDAGKPFLNDPSQMVTDDQCNRPDWRKLSIAWPAIPRDAFDFVWLTNTIRPYAPAPDWAKPIWTNEHSALYRIDHRQDDSTTAKAKP
jgi:hypothetical protein